MHRTTSLFVFTSIIAAATPGLAQTPNGPPAAVPVAAAPVTSSVCVAQDPNATNIVPLALMRQANNQLKQANAPSANLEAEIARLERKLPPATEQNCRGRRLNGDANRPDTAFATANDVLLIRFARGNAPLTVGEAGNVTVTLRVGTHDEAYSQASISQYKQSETLPIFLSAVGLLKSAHHGDLVYVIVSSDTPSDPVIFRHRRIVDFYGIQSATFGFWIPVGLFSTDFKSTQNGVSFAAAPIGIAWGLKTALTDSFYLGYSAIFSWLIFPGKDVNGVPDGTYNLQSFTAGAMIDISNYAFAGYGFGFDARQNHANPGSMFIIGAGPGLLQLIKSKM